MKSPALLNQYLNRYLCPTCSYEWYDVWDCGVDERCEHCNTRHINPVDSLQLPAGGLDELCVWNDEFSFLVDDDGHSLVDDEI